MGLLRSIETGIERVVDGTVGRVVRVSVQPVEIARKLAKELEDGKVEAGGRTFVPSQYTVYLPPKDRARFSEFEASLRVELAAYLAEHVRREGYSVRSRPTVTFETADELASGTFGIATDQEVAAPQPRPIPAEPIPAPPAEPAMSPPPLLDTPMFAPPVQPELTDLPVVDDPVILQGELDELEPAADFDVPEPEPLPEHAADPAPPVAAEPATSPEASPIDLPAPFLPAPAASAPAPFLPVPAPPLPLPLPTPASELPELPAEPTPAPAPPVPAPVGTTQTVSAADAARAGLAHSTDSLIVDGRRYTLTGAVTTIGRSSACDVTLDDASASRTHAELRRRGGKTVLVDLDSTNGTLVNGRRVREAPLRAGDRITIGTTAIVFERAS